ncbi:interleukin-8-like [Pimephales promelas]|uniref:interleukin-8-like n=1 Tax=Pimephales promelas TaxID=90988 RepID=UPI001955505A|nr:interleukin-8-like [Pimephales promelas]
MMKFTVTAVVFLICSAALLSTTEGTPLMDMRCRCIQTHSKPPIPAGRILSLRVIPARPQCRNEEIIATLKKGEVCLNPKADWVISLKEEIYKRTNSTLLTNSTLFTNSTLLTNSTPLTSLTTDKSTPLTTDNSTPLTKST